MANSKDKRMSQFQKVKLDRKRRERYRKIEKLKKKNNVVDHKVPRSVLMTEEEKQLNKLIKTQNKERSKMFNEIKQEDNSLFLEQMRECLEKCDLFIEVIDYRDIKGSRSKKVEELLRENNRQIFAYLSFYTEDFSIDLSEIENDGIKIIRDVSIFKDKKRVCVFGMPKSGKFTASKQIEEISPNVEMTIVRTPLKNITISEVFRSAVDESKYECYEMFKNVFEFINPVELRDFYKIGTFSNAEEFCKLVGSKSKQEMRQKKRIESGAIQFIRDIKEQRILWAKVNDQYIFKFLNK